MLLRSAKFFLYASVFSVAVVLPDTYFPFIGGKYYFFRLTVEAASALTLLWWAFAGGDLYARFRRASKQPLFLAVSAFVLVVVLASLFAYDSHAAFWSNYERGDGGFQMLHYYAFFILLTLLFQEEKEWRLLFKLSLAAALAMIFYGLLAAAGAPSVIGPYYHDGVPIADTFWGRLLKTRFWGSLGNPAYVAPYLLFSMFYAGWLWLKEKGERYRSWIYGGLLAVSFLFFILSQTRGGFVGFAAAALVFFLYVVFFSRRFRRAGIIGLAALLLLGGGSLALRNNPVVNKLPVSRIWEISFADQTFQTRLWTWNSAWQGFKERPLLGWGPENFSTVFDAHFDPRHYDNPEAETWFDRAHSTIFDYLAETGLLGLLSYLTMFVVFLWLFFRRWTNFSVWQKGLLLSIIVAYGIQGLVLFDVLATYSNVFLLFAFVSSAPFVHAATHESQS